MLYGKVLCLNSKTFGLKQHQKLDLYIKRLNTVKIETKMNIKLDKLFKLNSDRDEDVKSGDRVLTTGLASDAKTRRLL